MGEVHTQHFEVRLRYGENASEQSFLRTLLTLPTLQKMRSQMSILGTQVGDLQSMMSEKDAALARLQNEFGPSLVTNVTIEFS